ncbi:hypothetical protein HDU91_006857 [Kappamyces sp. JEL0680]|nr:hypothetical protein HDU91_006857 [Kappamyces sp. JEL0680]
MQAVKTIATHSGTQAFAVSRQDAKLIRTRDPELIDKADIVVDVGGVYEPERHRYDHHQRGFAETFSPAHPIKLSSAGLVYKHFGKRVIASLLGWDLENSNIPLLYTKVYDSLIEMFDGVDNGVEQYPSNVDAAYSDPTCISARVGRLNPRWNQPTNDGILFKQFQRAVELTGEELVATVENIALSSLPARSIVADALRNRFAVHGSGKIVLLPQYCPFKSHLFDLEEEEGIAGDKQPLYVLFQDTSSAWRIQAVPVAPDSFSSRKALPEPWRGVRDDALSDLTGVPGCIFIHASGFIGGAKSQEAVLALAKLAIDF